MNNDFIINKHWSCSNVPFPQEFEILHYSNLFYLSVERKKMVCTKEGLQVVKTVN